LALEEADENAASNCRWLAGLSRVRLTAMIGERQVNQAALFYEFSLAMRRIDLA
jgi:hypothetical protein